MVELLMKRRSVRVFSPEKIQEEAKTRILKAGLLAPTGKGKTSIEYIVIEDEAQIRDLVHVKNQGTKPFKTAMLAIIVLGDTAVTDTWVEDASIAATFMQLEITSQGLGSTWVQIDKRGNDAGQSAVDILRERYSIPLHMQPLCVIALGHKAEDPKPYTEEKFNFSRVHDGIYCEK